MRLWSAWTWGFRIGNLELTGADIAITERRVRVWDLCNCCQRGSCGSTSSARCSDDAALRSNLHRSVVRHPSFDLPHALQITTRPGDQCMRLTSSFDTSCLG